MEASLIPTATVVRQQEPVGPSTKLPDSGQGPGKTMRLASRTQARAGFAESIVQLSTPTAYLRICPLLPSGKPLKAR